VSSEQKLPPYRIEHRYQGPGMTSDAWLLVGHIDTHDGALAAARKFREKHPKEAVRVITQHVIERIP
jgi:ribulose bisphosphate carboxylase small subunit